MAKQYGRKISIVIGTPGGAALDFSDFKVTFRIRRGDFQSPNSCDVRLWNLADNTAQRIKTEFTEIAISAGYENSFGKVFQGTLKQVRLGRLNQLDSYVDVTAAEGDEAYLFSHMALSLRAGAKPMDSVEAFLGAMRPFGITKGYVPDMSTNGTVRGRVLYGATRDEVRDFAFANKMSWNINDSRLSIIPLQSYIPSGNVPVISPSTGLIGVPEQTQNGLAVRVLLNPNIKIGQLVKLETTAINQLRYGLDSESFGNNVALALSATRIRADGLYYCMIASHSGDTRGQEWYTDLICLAVDATVPAQLAAQAAVLPAAASIRLD
jgi:hypothetical protein